MPQSSDSSRHCGGQIKVPTLSLFMTLWVSLFAHSAKAKALWKDHSGRAMPTYSKTRWWSKWEIMSQVYRDVVCLGFSSYVSYC